MRARRIAPWAAVLLTAACLVCGVVLELLSGADGSGAPDVAAWVLATLASAAAGFVLATRRPENPIGWLLLANGLMIIVIGIADSYARYTVVAEPGALHGAGWAVLMSERLWPLLFAGVAAIAWVFPDGRLPSPRWRPFAAAAVTTYAVLVLASLFEPGGFAGAFAGVSSPLPELPESVAGLLFAVSGAAALATLIGGVVAVRTRLRRSSGIERLQLRWLAYAAILVPGTVAVCLAEIALTGDDGAATTVALVLTLIAIPAAIAVAVMRYRLYEIDRLINRTLVYAALTAGLAATFAAVSLTLGVAIGGGSTAPTAAATLAVALAFGPLRSRLQMVVDRRFDRARYEGLRRVERFLAELRAGRAAPEETGEVLADALGDPGLELFFWLDDRHVDASGRVVEELPAGGGARTPVRRGELRLATVVHDPALAQRPDLLDSVIAAAGLAIEIGRLRVEVRRRLAEVEESRARIVTAGYEERRRLERDLHDGAQQRLVSIGLALRHVEARLPPAGEQARALNATVAEVTGAIEELRELARGVRPAGLDDGLAPALRELASRSPLRTRVEAVDERFDDRLETAAYFVASEALANAAKHARASRVTLSAARRNGSLVLSVRDDGVGGACPADGSGLVGMTDRVAALGGSLRVASPPGEGTTVTAELPCGS